MNSRRPIIALAGVGVIIIAVLTFVPYSLTMVKRAGNNVATAVQTSLGKEPPPAFEAEMRQPIVPQYDVALWYGARGEEPERHGVLIQTLDGQHVFAAHNADTTFNPASLAKLTVTLFALKKLGPDYRFTTRVYADGKVDASGVLDGNLYLAGNDPSFGDASANLIAKELRARGVKRVKGRLLASPGFSFNFNERAEESSEYAARVMQLKQSGTGMEEAQGEELFALDSNPLREILLYMNAHSNNFVADRLGAFLGGPQAIVRFLVEELKLPPEQVSLETASGLYNNRMTPRGVLAVIKALLEEAARHNLKPEDLMPVVGCDWGTVRRRMEGTGFECSLVGKTGTLTTTDGGMSNLAGVVFTKDSEPILFAILAQGNRIWEHKQMADQLLAETINGHQPAPIIDAKTRRQLLPPNNLKISGQQSAISSQPPRSGGR
ncbi:MAG TPA: D-alanyl-D-alanine carboxypeptidase [Pyrinomonadaceae bacterium]|jgi:D-alanyl-D-alanine carboxypeptidase/D-alanyl-D-alanine-endopeptidase (penicillin-binding protein 4)|nr:D-alanyl-D-alanine carboxypeptidase [Pyrinomonadaceae bacterium]